MFIHEETLRQAVKELKEYDSATGISLNKYIGLLELAKACGGAIIPLKKYTVESSKLTDSLNQAFTIVPFPSRPSTSERLIELTFGTNWHEDAVKLFLRAELPPLFQLAVICLRYKPLRNNTDESVVSDFIKTYNLPVKRDGNVPETSKIKTSDKPVSSQRFIEICEEAFGGPLKSEAKFQSYTPSCFVASAAGEIDRAPFTQPLLEKTNLFGVIMMVRVAPKNAAEPSSKPTPTAQLPKSPLQHRLTRALAAKPFVVLAGGTGTGKTRAARQVARQIAGKDNVRTVAVGADWTDNRPLLGFRNLLSTGGASYVAPGTLQLILAADKNLRDAANEARGETHSGSPIGESVRPFFLILDEMNLSHVERYFADFLSSMESGEALKLHDYDAGLKADGLKDADGADLIIPPKVEWPRNLFVIGTVNIDETTYMFSPKVLDRAHVIEFKVDWDDIKTGLSAPPAGELVEWDEDQTRNFIRIALDDKKALAEADQKVLEDVLAGVHACLNGSRYNFAHRTARECLNYVAAAQKLSEIHLAEQQDIRELADLAVLQKALPKLNGAAGSLTEVLDSLAKFAEENRLTNCATKLKSMAKQLKNDQFVSFIQ